MAGRAERVIRDLYRAEDYRVEDSVGYMITRVRASLFSSVDRELAGLGISAAQGAILGKAMGSLEKGEGLVLVLVGLQ